MDWTSEEGRSLLWKAYPDGYLDKRGVLTVGGWTYLGERCWAAPSSSMVQGWDGVRYPGHALSCGDLLPLPDPSDSATWACLLEDLSSACKHPTGIFWNIDYWRIFAFPAPVLGSDEALVRARIMLREEAEESNP